MATKIKQWRVLDYGDVPPTTAPTVEFTCLHCMHDSLLPVVGRAIAQLEQGLVFDIGPRVMPRQIQCRNCRVKLEVANVIR
jgi:hypothetical protein